MPRRSDEPYTASSQLSEGVAALKTFQHPLPVLHLRPVLARPGILHAEFSDLHAAERYRIAPSRSLGTGNTSWRSYFGRTAPLAGYTAYRLL